MRVWYGLLLACVAACGSGSTSYSSNPPAQPPPPPPPPGGSTANVTIRDYSYSPSAVTVSAGTTVRWSNSGPTSHSVTSNTPGQFDSGTLSGPVDDGSGYGGMTSGASYSRAFTTQGTFPYHCKLHAGMTGTVVVTP